MQVIVEPRIESGIPLAPVGAIKVPLYTPRHERMKKMKVGDSYAVPYNDDKALAQRITSAASNFAIKHEWKMASRRLIEDGRKVVRIWRIA